MEKWDRRMLQLAQFISTWSKDPNTGVGAVIADDLRRVRGVGYNGLPRFIEDSDKRLEDRELKLQLTVHAEENAILNTGSTDGHAIYVYPMPPCARCMAKIIQADLRRVICTDYNSLRWADSIKLAKEIAHEATIEFKVLDLT